MKKIAVDCRTFSYTITGVGSLTRNIVDALISYFPDVTFYLMSPKKFHESLERTYNQRNVVVVKFPTIFEKVPDLLWFNFWMPFYLRKKNIDMLLIPIPETPFIFFGKTKRMNFVHDVVNLEYESSMTLKNRIKNKLMYDYAIQKADFIWCNSFYTKSKLLEYYTNLRSEKIFVGASIDSTVFLKKNVDSELSNELRAKYAINRKFVLFVGSIEPRKNLSFLLRLVPKLNQNGYQTLIVGARGWKNSDVYSVVNQENFPKDAVTFCGYVTVNELVSLYNMASCYISTSLNEGFGMPQLEALFCGCPVVCPNNSAMIEVVEGRGTLVDGWNEEMWINAVLDAAEKRVVSKRNLEDYDWSKIIANLDKFLKIHETVN